MWMVTLALMLGQTANEVTLQPLSGPDQSGILVNLDDKQAVIDVQGDHKTFDLRDVRVVSVNGVAMSPRGEVNHWISLVDGSQILATGFQVQERKANVQIGERTLEIETRSVRAVRLRPPSADLDGQWQTAVTSEIAGDVVVLRRSPTSLDQLEGILQDIDEETVGFQFDDELIPVNRDKLEGIIYFHPVAGSYPKRSAGSSSRLVRSGTPNPSRSSATNCTWSRRPVSRCNCRCCKLRNWTSPPATSSI